MPLFHFSLRSGEATLGTAEADLIDITAAGLEATGYVGRMLQAHPDRLRPDSDWQLDLTDDRGLILLTLMVLAIPAPVRH